MVMIDLTEQEFKKRYRPISPITHKGLQGHALLIGGSYGKIGAVILSTKAALKSGCGLVTALVPKCGYIPLQSVNPEVMVLTDEDEKCLTNIDFPFSPNAIGIGPGLGLDYRTEKALEKFIQVNDTCSVLDADAINFLSRNPAICDHLKPKTIITPHGKEFERLVGSWTSEIERLQKAIDFSLKYDLIVVLKGAPSIVVVGHKLYENRTGNAALATAGSGDVLTGIITGFLAQSYSAEDAALMGVYLHGLCADKRNESTSMQSFIASDIIENLGRAFRKLGL